MKVKCDAESDPTVKAKLVAEWELHKRKAERAYQVLKNDSARAKSDPNMDVICFDLQQPLPTLLLSTNVVFYKRQMWCYNLGVHDCESEKGVMCIWDETKAGRGSQEIGSCVLKFLRSKSSSAKHLIMYSDSCGGQNRNINIACFCLHIVASVDLSYEVIDHKFMGSGHSYLPNDRDFASVENAKRRTQVVYVPSEWETLVRECRRNNPFEVISMETDDFVSSVAVKNTIINRKVTTKKGKVDWLKIRWLRYKKCDPLKIYFHTTHNELEDWQCIDVKRRTKGRPPDLGRITLPTLCTAPCGLNRQRLPI